ncbi:hypothetical protein [Solimicrobium silvestre]|uniref:hypothetical protein n=1 Tax=Solimicrobium silvestre TaxID=2099400 RepID=UPI0013FE2124|nr:hypothetical protein [Solimicrobium silvestre]
MLVPAFTETSDEMSIGEEIVQRKIFWLNRGGTQLFSFYGLDIATPQTLDELGLK